MLPSLLNTAPVGPSLSQQRAQKAQQWVDGEIGKLLEIMYQVGLKFSTTALAETGLTTQEVRNMFTVSEKTKRITPFNEEKVLTTFGNMFQVYQHVSDSLVGILMRARKRRFVSFEGGLLFQGKHDHVVITLEQDGIKFLQALNESKTANRSEISQECVDRSEPGRVSRIKFEQIEMKTQKIKTKLLLPQTVRNVSQEKEPDLEPGDHRPEKTMKGELSKGIQEMKLSMLRSIKDNERSNFNKKKANVQSLDEPVAQTEFPFQKLTKPLNSSEQTQKYDQIRKKDTSKAINRKLDKKNIKRWSRRESSVLSNKASRSKISSREACTEGMHKTPRLLDLLQSLKEQEDEHEDSSTQCHQQTLGDIGNVVAEKISMFNHRESRDDRHKNRKIVSSGESERISLSGKNRPRYSPSATKNIKGGLTSSSKKLASNLKTEETSKHDYKLSDRMNKTPKLFKLLEALKREDHCQVDVK